MAKSTEVIANFTIGLVAVGALTFIVGIFQLWVFGTQATRLKETVDTMKDTAQRQLRAYVFIQDAYITNVAPPPPLYPGQIRPPTAAEVTNPAVGPVATLTIRNFGQTPAHDVIHWGNICIREYPLVSTLPPKDMNLPTTRMPLSPDGRSSKNLAMSALLTPQEIQNLRNGTHGIYVYGDIIYKDIFGNEWFSNYRSVHINAGGLIGISTNLTGCEDGNGFE